MSTFIFGIFVSPDYIERRRPDPSRRVHVQSGSPRSAVAVDAVGQPKILLFFAA